MLLVFTSEELERLVENFSGKRIKIEMAGDNKLKVSKSLVNVSLFLEKVEPKKISMLYKMNSITNFFANRFVKLAQPGIQWDKEENRLEINLDELIPDEKLKNFYIRQLLITDQKMIIEFDISSKNHLAENKV